MSNSDIEKVDDKYSTHAEHHENVPAGSGSAPGALALDDSILMAGEREEKLTAFVVFLTFAGAVSGLCFGYDTGVISAALVSIRDDLGHALSDTEKEWISTATSIGALFGALSAGGLADRIGRKWVLAVGDVWFVIGAVIICASFSVPQIIVGRLILGLGVGALVTVQSIAITGGQFISYCIGIPLTGEGGWRVQFGIGIIPAAVQAAAIHFLPESPRYDLLRGRRDAAFKTIARISSSSSDAFLEHKMAALEATVAVSAQFQAQYNFKQRLRLLITKGKYRKPAIIALGIGIFQQLCGFNSLMYYSATIFKMAGFDNPTAVGLIVSGTNWFWTIVAMNLLDRVGKRRLLLLTYPGMVLGLALASIAFWKMTGATGHRLVEGVSYPTTWSNFMLGCMVIFISFYATGSGNITWTVGELFPLEMRGLGAAVLAGGIWAANIVISATFLTLMNAIGPTPTFALYAAICALGFIFIFALYPEPSGLSLEEIETIFEYGFGVAKSREIRSKHKEARRQLRDEANAGTSSPAGSF